MRPRLTLGLAIWLCTAVLWGCGDNGSDETAEDPTEGGEAVSGSDNRTGILSDEEQIEGLDPCIALSVQGGETTIQFMEDGVLGYVPVEILSNAAAFPLDSTSLWRMAFWTDLADEEDTWVDASSAAWSSCNPLDAGGIELVWGDIPSPSGSLYAISVQIEPTSNGLLFDAVVDLSSLADSDHPFAVGAVELPQLAFADLGEQSDLFTGMGAGIRVSDPVRNANHKGQALIGEHPDSTMSLPLWGFANGGAVVGMTPNEPAPERYAWKEFRALGIGEHLEWAISRMTDAPYQPQGFDLPGETLISVVPCLREKDCWFDLAQWYRNLRIASGELTRGPISSLSPDERDLFSYSLITALGNPSPDDAHDPDYGYFVTFNDTLNTYLGADPTGVINLWFDWHANVFDHDLPEHLPPRDKAGLVAAIETLETKGTTVIPYTNTSFWGDQVPSLADLNVIENAGCYDRWGELRQGLLVKSSPTSGHIVVDFGRSFLEETLIGKLFTATLDAAPFSGFYLDVFPSVRRCFSETGGTLSTSGTAGPTGTQSYVDAIIQTLNNHPNNTRPFVFNEAASELMVNQTHGSTMYRTVNFWDLPATRSGYIPLFDAVYHDYFPLAVIAIEDMPGLDAFGYPAARQKAATNDLGDLWLLLQFNQIKLAFSYATGMRLVWAHRDIPSINPLTNEPFHTLIDDPAFKQLPKMFRDIYWLQTHPNLKMAFQEGEMVRPAEIETDTFAPIALLVPWGSEALPLVFSYAFRDSLGRVVVTLANWSLTETTVNVGIDPAQWGLPDDAKLIFHVPNDVTGVVDVVEADPTEPSEEFPLYIPASSVSAILIQAQD